MTKGFVIAGLLLLLPIGCSRSTTEEAPTAGPSAPSTGGPVLSVSTESVEASAVLEHLKAQGLPIDTFQSFTVDTSPFEAPGSGHLYEGLALFHDTRVDAVLIEGTGILKFDDSGGAVEVFKDRETLNARTRQIEAVRAFANQSGAKVPPEYQIRKGTVLLRLGVVLKDYLDEYEAAMAAYES